MLALPSRFAISNGRIQDSIKWLDLKWTLGIQYDIELVLQSVADPGISESRVRGGALELLGSGDCFDVSSHIPFAFVLRVENKIHIVNISFKVHVYASHALKIYKNKPLEKFKRRRVMRRSWIHLWQYIQIYFSWSGLNHNVHVHISIIIQRKSQAICFLYTHSMIHIFLELNAIINTGTFTIFEEVKRHFYL